MDIEAEFLCPQQFIHSTSRQFRGLITVPAETLSPAMEKNKMFPSPGSFPTDHKVSRLALIASIAPLGNVLGPCQTPLAKNDESVKFLNGSGRSQPITPFLLGKRTSSMRQRMHGNNVSGDISLSDSLVLSS